LGKFIIVTSDLRNDRCYRWIKLEVGILNEEAPYPTKIERGKEFLEVEIEHEPALYVRPSVGNYGMGLAKSVRKRGPFRFRLQLLPTLIEYC
jgi:hypothetical protein